MKIQAFIATAITWALLFSSCSEKKWTEKGATNTGTQTETMSHESASKTNEEFIALQKQVQEIQTQLDKVSSLPLIQAEFEKMIEFNATIVSDTPEIEEMLEPIKANLFPGVNYSVVSSTSEEGKQLIDTFWAKYLPLFVAGTELEKTQLKAWLPQIAQKQGEQYNVDIATIAQQFQVNIEKQFLTVPKDLEFDAVKWPKESKVTIIEFSDFECPYCAKFFEDTYKQLVKEYGDKVQIRFKNLPLDFHKNAQKAAEAAQCANKQGKFWEMHDKLFENSKQLSEANYKKWAIEIGLNQKNFETCLDTGETAQEVAQQAQQAAEYWVRGTPGFFINNKFLWGAYPIDSFKKIIDEELAK